MIKFNKLSTDEPYLLFKSFYKKSLNEGQKSIDAICIASYSPYKKEVNARYVNLKLVNEKHFIFFSNYNSPKSIEFNDHDQISAVIFWESINVQIRMKASIDKTSKSFNEEYFANRNLKKNAIAISSNQSSEVRTYSDVKKNYEYSLKFDDLKKCPSHWGGYSFTPYYFEFWEGHELRINKRQVFNLIDGSWRQSFLEP